MISNQVITLTTNNDMPLDVDKIDQLKGQYQVNEVTSLDIDFPAGDGDGDEQAFTLDFFNNLAAIINHFNGISKLKIGFNNINTVYEHEDDIQTLLSALKSKQYSHIIIMCDDYKFLYKFLQTVNLSSIESFELQINFYNQLVAVERSFLNEMSEYLLRMSHLKSLIFCTDLLDENNKFVKQGFDKMIESIIRLPTLSMLQLALVDTNIHILSIKELLSRAKGLRSLTFENCYPPEDLNNKELSEAISENSNLTQIRFTDQDGAEFYLNNWLTVLSVLCLNRRNQEKEKFISDRSHSLKARSTISVLSNNIFNKNNKINGEAIKRMALPTDLIESLQEDVTALYQSHKNFVIEYIIEYFLFKLNSPDIKKDDINPLRVRLDELIQLRSEEEKGVIITTTDQINSDNLEYVISLPHLLAEKQSNFEMPEIDPHFKVMVSFSENGNIEVHTVEQTKIFSISDLVKEKSNIEVAKLKRSLSEVVDEDRCLKKSRI